MNGLIVFLAIFVGLPLFELYWLIEVGQEIGALPTILLTVVTAVVGGALVRYQGFSTLMRVQHALERGEVPALEMVEGFILLLCGLLLLLPGFFTDILGFLALIPPLRRLAIIVFARARGVMEPIPDPAQRPPQDQQQKTLEGEYWREDDDDRPGG